MKIIILIIAIIVLICSVRYYKDTREIQSLEKEKLRLEIQLLKKKNNI